MHCCIHRTYVNDITIQQLSVHSRVHSLLRPYKCRICNKTFAQAGNLNTHYKIHQTEKCTFKCDECENTFSSNGNLKTQHKIHTQERSLICGSCQRIFMSMYNLNQHLKTHLKERCNVHSAE